MESARPTTERSNSLARTGFVWHERYAWHNTGRQAGTFFADASGWLEPNLPHRENADGKRRIVHLLEATGLLDQLQRIPPRLATEGEITRLHDPVYVSRIREQSEAWGGDGGDGDTPFGRGSYEVALLAVGGVMAAVDAVLDGQITNAYALVRPPGHHAVADMGMGYCLFGNIALAARHAQVVRGLRRLAIVDWDVHHGNGTQDFFYDDPTVLTISLHQDNNFPLDSGAVTSNGAGAGAGANINVPLPPGSGRGAYNAAFERVVVPALDRFEPELILVASGFDASAMDPLGRMALPSGAYKGLTRYVLDAADRHCDGRLVLAHEGGYAEELVPFCGLAVLEELSGIQTDCQDTIIQAFGEAWGYQELQDHQAAAIERAAALVERVPRA
jgi:acetoin utilization deacetylase AcuC-like enzyme